MHGEENGTAAFSNIVNLIKDLGEENLDIELLMNGTGVKMMLEESERLRKIDYLLKKGVKFRVCSNSLDALKISEDDLIEEAKTVPSGVGELVKRQDEGWAYVKV
ncbi:MAG: DsrE family protein [Thermoplasmata archaeon]